MSQSSALNRSSGGPNSSDIFIVDVFECASSDKGNIESIVHWSWHQEILLVF